MSTFAHWAVEESQALVDDLNAILGRLVTDKRGLAPGTALDALTAAQASLLAVRARAGDMRSKWEAALRTGACQSLPVPGLDRKRLAAGEHDEEETR